MKVYVLQVKEYDDASPRGVLAVTATIAAAKRIAEARCHEKLRPLLCWRRDRFGVWRLGYKMLKGQAYYMIRSMEVTK